MNNMYDLVPFFGDPSYRTKRQEKSYDEGFKRAIKPVSVMGRSGELHQLPVKVFPFADERLVMAVCSNWLEFMACCESEHPSLEMTFPYYDREDVYFARRAMFGVIVASTDVSSPSATLSRISLGDATADGKVQRYIRRDPFVYISGGIDGTSKAYLPYMDDNDSIGMIGLLRNPNVFVFEKLHDPYCTICGANTPDVMLLSRFFTRKYPSERYLIQLPWCTSYDKPQILLQVGADYKHFKRFQQYVGALCSFSKTYRSERCLSLDKS